MDKDRLEAIFKRSLRDYRSEMNINQGWEELEQSLFKERRRKIILLLFGLGSLVLLFFATYTHRKINPSPNQPSNAVLEQYASTNDIQEKALIDILSTESNNPTYVNESQINEITTDDIINKNTPGSQKVSFSEKLSRKSRPYQNPTTAAENQTYIDVPSLDNTAKSPSSLSVFYSKKESLSNEKDNHQEGPKEKNLVYQGPKSHTLTKHETSHGAPTISKIIEKLESTSIIDHLHSQTLAAPGLETLDQHSTPQRKWRMGISTGGGIWQHNYSSTENQDEVFIMTLNPLETFQIGATIEYALSSRLHFNTGIEYQLLNEVFEFEQSSPFSLEVDGVQIITVDPVSGDSTFLTGSIIQTGVTNRSIRNFNSYKRWNIPLGISYHFTSDSRLSFFPEVGAILNLSLQKSGKELYDEMVIEIDDANLYRRSLDLQLFLRPTIQLAMGPYSSLRLQPGIRGSLSNWINRSSVSLQPNIYTISISYMRSL